MNVKPYSQWSLQPDGRWIDAANVFGHHLMASSRDYAFRNIPASADPMTQEIAKKCALDAIYGLLMILDGIPSNNIDEDTKVTYSLTAQVTRVGQTVERVELAPEGDGLCMGYSEWVKYGIKGDA